MHELQSRALHQEKGLEYFVAVGLWDLQALPDLGQDVEVQPVEAAHAGAPLRAHCGEDAHGLPVVRPDFEALVSEVLRLKPECCAACPIRGIEQPPRSL